MNQIESLNSSSGATGLRGLFVAVTTPITETFACNSKELSKRCHYLLESGCDGLALFGTTGEGPLFSIDQRISALDDLFDSGIDPSKVVVSVSAMTLPEIVRLTRHATDTGCAGVLMMPPFFFRDQISDAGAFEFYSSVIELTARANLKLILYHYPDISGISITHALARRIIEKFPGIVVGIKDSGGDWDYTESLLTRFSNLSILTGTEVHVPRLLASGGAGTVCGLGNVIPGLLKQMFDAPTLSARRRFIPLIHAADVIMSRGTFVCCLKAIIAAQTNQPDWLRVIPPLYPLSAYERRLLVRDFNRFESSISQESIEEKV